MGILKNYKMKKIMILISLALVALFLSGCSSAHPVITNVAIKNLKYYPDKATIGFNVDVQYATDQQLKNPTNGIMRLVFDADPQHPQEIDWGFLPGQRNADVQFSLGWDNYTPGSKVTGKVIMIQGTQTISSKNFEIVYTNTSTQ